MNEAKKKALSQLEQERIELMHEKNRLKWFLVLAFTTWPLGFLWRPWLCVLIFFSWICFYLSGRYISYFHRRECERRIEDVLSQ